MGLRSGLPNLGPPCRRVADLAAPIQLAPAAQQSTIKSAHHPPRSDRGQPVEAPHLVGHSVRSSVLCGPVSCREVDDVATTNESVARLECGGADGVDAVEPVAAYAGGSGRAGG